jgi:hypothetical protein
VNLEKDGFNCPLDIVREARLALLDNMGDEDGRELLFPPPHETMTIAIKTSPAFCNFLITFIASHLPLRNLDTHYS